jgi:hypothetical protein
MGKKLMRGIGAGLLATVAISAVSMQMKKPGRRFRRNAKKAYRIVSSIMDDVGVMMH